MLNEFQNPEIFRRSRLRDDFTIPGNIYEQFGIVAKICLMKCQILKNIGDLPQCKMWMNLPQTIYQDLFEESGGENDSIFLEIIYTKLVLAECDTSQRNKIFQELTSELSTKAQSAILYLHQLIQENKVDSETVMPFLQHIIIKAREGIALNGKKFVQMNHRGTVKWVQDMRGVNFEEIPKNFLMYRNSLMINNHFNVLC